MPQTLNCHRGLSKPSAACFNPEVSPVTNRDACTVCGTCASVCPTAAISIDDRVTTNVGQCIRCCACIKNCPEGARVMEDDTWKHIANWLNEHCGVRKEPQMFGLGDL